MTVKCYKEAIEHVCGSVYGEFESVMKGAVEKSKGKYPGIRWKSSSGKEGERGFEVSNYYMKHKREGAREDGPPR